MAELLEEGLILARQSEDVNLEILLSNSLAASYWEGKHERMRAMPITRRALELARQVSSSQQPLLAINLAAMEHELGNPDKARLLLDEALISLEQNYDPRTLGFAERNKAKALAELGEVSEARLWFGRSLQTFERTENNYEFAASVAHFASLEARIGNSRSATQFAAFAKKQITETLGAEFYATTRTWFEPMVAQLRDTLGGVEFEQAWTEGRALSRNQVLALAVPMVPQENTSVSSV